MFFRGRVFSPALKTGPVAAPDDGLEFAVLAACFLHRPTEFRFTIRAGICLRQTGQTLYVFRYGISLAFIISSDWIKDPAFGQRRIFEAF
jgi:hypothetical protein